MGAITVTFDEEAIDQLAEKIAARISANGNGAVAEAEAEAETDDFGEEVAKPKEITLADVQESIREALGKHGKEKVQGFVKKVAGVGKVSDIAREKYQTVIDGLKKLK